MVGMRTKKRKGSGDSAVSASGEAEVAALPAKRVSWEELLERALAALDKQSEEDFAAKKAKAEWRRERNKRKGLRLEIDYEGVRRTLVEYYEGCVGFRPFQGFKKVFAANGVSMADYFDGEMLEPELHLVFRYTQRLRDSATKEAALDLGRQAQESQERLVTEADCKLNQRAVELSLKASMRDVYGDGDSGGGSGGSGKAQVTYNLPNLTLNMITAPAGLIGAAKQPATIPATIEAEVVSDGS